MCRVWGLSDRGLGQIFKYSVCACRDGACPVSRQAFAYGTRLVSACRDAACCVSTLALLPWRRGMPRLYRRGWHTWRRSTLRLYRRGGVRLPMGRLSKRRGMPRLYSGDWKGGRAAAGGRESKFAFQIFFVYLQVETDWFPCAVDWCIALILLQLA